MRQKTNVFCEGKYFIRVNSVPCILIVASQVYLIDMFNVIILKSPSNMPRGGTVSNSHFNGIIRKPP